MLNDFLYASAGVSEPMKAVIVLPEIYGLKAFAKELADTCAAELGFTGYALDYFFELTGQANDFDYRAGVQRGMELMGQMTGEKFLAILERAVQAIQERQPQLAELMVIGFCFGGRLAFLSGVNPRVQRIVSFYGAGSNGLDFYQGDSAIGALTTARRHDDTLRVFAAFGAQDESIPAEDRAKIAQRLGEAGIHYEAHEYAAGHAFFNDDRPDRYVATAAQASWHDLKAWLQASA